MAAHSATFHAVNASVMGVSLLPLLGMMPYWSALAGLIYYIILIWKEGVIQSFYQKGVEFWRKHVSRSDKSS